MPAAMELARRFRPLGARAVAQSKMAVRMCGDADLTTARNIGLEALAMLIGRPMAGGHGGLHGEAPAALSSADAAPSGSKAPRPKSG